MAVRVLGNQSSRHDPPRGWPERYSERSLPSIQAGNPPPGRAQVVAIGLPEALQEQCFLSLDTAVVDPAHQCRYSHAGQPAGSGQSEASPHQHSAQIAGMANDPVRAALDQRVIAGHAQGPGIETPEHGRGPDPEGQASDHDRWTDDARESDSARIQSGNQRGADQRDTIAQAKQPGRPGIAAAGLQGLRLLALAEASLENEEQAEDSVAGHNRPETITSLEHIAPLSQQDSPFSSPPGATAPSFSILTRIELSDTLSLACLATGSG